MAVNVIKNQFNSLLPIINNSIDQIKAWPIARPSSPSVILKAYINPTTASKVKGPAHDLRLMRLLSNEVCSTPTIRPKSPENMPRHKRKDKNNLMVGLRSKRSSANPIKKAINVATLRPM